MEENNKESKDFDAGKITIMVIGGAIVLSLLVYTGIRAFKND